jgi:hypothetical protein
MDKHRREKTQELQEETPEALDSGKNAIASKRGPEEPRIGIVKDQTWVANTHL